MVVFVVRIGMVWELLYDSTALREEGMVKRAVLVLVRSVLAASALAATSCCRPPLEYNGVPLPEVSFSFKSDSISRSLTIAKEVAESIGFKVSDYRAAGLRAHRERPGGVIDHITVWMTEVVNMSINVYVIASIEEKMYGSTSIVLLPLEGGGGRDRLNEIKLEFISEFIYFNDERIK